MTLDKTDHGDHDKGGDFDVASHADQRARTCWEVAILLGLEKSRWSDTKAREAVLRYYEEHGRRPTQKAMVSLNDWLRRNRDSSLAQFCDELGLPVLRRSGLTEGVVRGLVQDFYEKEGRRPTQADMPRENAWLRYRGSSLRHLCDELGQPPRIRLDRSKKGIVQEAQDFYEEHGRRPSRADMQNNDAWLRNHGSSLGAVCDELGYAPLPGAFRPGHTLGSVKQEVRDFYEEHGRRPTQKELPSIHHWLRRRRGSSLSRLCDEMGLPGWFARGLNEKEIRRDVQEFHEREGRRPRGHERRAFDRWLRKQGSSLTRLCDEMGLSGGRVRNRTKKDVEAAVRKFYEEHGRRPTQKEFQNEDAWLRNRDTSVSRLCDEMGLPERRQPTKKTIEQEILEFYRVNGRRPHCREMASNDMWLRARGTSLPAFCKEMGLK